MILFTFFLVFSFTGLQAQGFSSLEEQMSGKEYRESGLAKLSDEELARLNQWIRNHLNGDISPLPAAQAPRVNHYSKPAEQPGDMRGLERAEDNEIIESYIPGHFTGWHGDTEITLANGMIWKQTCLRDFNVQLENPKVTITPGMFGSWKLKVDGYNTSCKVKRIK